MTTMSTFTLMLLGLALVGAVLYAVALWQERHQKSKR